MKTNNPIAFISGLELFTATIVGGFISWKLLNSIYDNLFIPVYDSTVETNNAENYYVNIGPDGMPIGKLIHEIIKWIILIIILMVFLYLI